jgi:hypothetical protein
MRNNDFHRALSHYQVHQSLKMSQDIAHREVNLLNCPGLQYVNIPEKYFECTMPGHTFYLHLRNHRALLFFRYISSYFKATNIVAVEIPQFCP